MSWGEASKELDHARGVVVANHDGFLVRSYDMSTDDWVWTFGHLRFPRLRDPQGSVYGDDPWGGRDVVPIDELRDYLEGWYWPRQAGVAPPPAGVLPVSTLNPPMPSGAAVPKP